jgi:V8-like Glu-specific endopeptidase
VPLIECPGAGGGSGFLVEHGGRRLVVTNRHVIDRARNGIVVHFFQPNAAGPDKLIVSREQAKLIAVHRAIDLAVIDVTEAAAELDKRNIRALPMLPAEQKPAVGEDVIVIGHPTGGALKSVLPHTLTKGIISAVHREIEKAPGTFVQINAQINPGNSGGPIFDGEGRVIGVATLGSRLSTEKTPRILEGLNFGVEHRWVYEILNDSSKSLTAQEIAALLKGGTGPVAGPGPGPRPGDNPLVKQFERKYKQLLDAGYKPLTGDLKTSGADIRLAGKDEKSFPLKLLAGDQVHIFVITTGSEDVDLFVHDGAGNLVVQDIRVNPDPEVAFEVLAAGEFRVRVQNLSANPCEGVLVVMLK